MWVSGTTFWCELALSECGRFWVTIICSPLPSIDSHTWPSWIIYKMELFIQKPLKCHPDMQLEWNTRQTNRFLLCIANAHYNIYDSSQMKTTFTIIISFFCQKKFHPSIFFHYCSFNLFPAWFYCVYTTSFWNLTLSCVFDLDSVICHDNMPVWPPFYLVIWYCAWPVWQSALTAGSSRCHVLAIKRIACTPLVALERTYLCRIMLCR